MAAVWSTRKVRTGDTTPVQFDAKWLDLSGVGTGPWAPGYVLLDETGAGVAQETNPLVVRTKRRTLHTVTIAATTNLISNIVDLEEGTLAGIIFPTAWTAAGLTFVGSFDGSTLCDLTELGGGERLISSTDMTAYTTVTTNARMLAWPVGDWSAPRFLALRAGTAAAPVAQSANRVFGLIAVH